MGAIAPHFCQDGARDFLKIGEKIGGEGVVAYLQRSSGRVHFHLCPHFYIPGFSPGFGNVVRQCPVTCMAQNL